MSELGEQIRQARLNEALDRYNVAAAKVAEATVEESKAAAAVARTMLLDIAADHPKIKAFSWSIAWEYDDEGGYYASTSIYPHGLLDGSCDFWHAEDALCEAASYLGEGPMCYLGPQDEEVTIAQLRSIAL